MSFPNEAECERHNLLVDSDHIITPESRNEGWSETPSWGLPINDGDFGLLVTYCYSQRWTLITRVRVTSLEAKLAASPLEAHRQPNPSPSFPIPCAPRQCDNKLIEIMLLAFPQSQAQDLTMTWLDLKEHGPYHITVPSTGTRKRTNGAKILDSMALIFILTRNLSA